MRGEHPHVPGVTDSRDSRAGCVDPHEEVRESTHKDEESVSRTEELRAWGQCLRTDPVCSVNLPCEAEPGHTSLLV